MFQPNHVEIRKSLYMYVTCMHTWWQDAYSLLYGPTKKPHRADWPFYNISNVYMSHFCVIA